MNLGIMEVEGPSLFVFFLQYRMLTTCVEHLSCKDKLVRLIVASVWQLYKVSGIILILQTKVSDIILYLRLWEVKGLVQGHTVCGGIYNSTPWYPFESTQVLSSLTHQAFPHVFPLLRMLPHLFAKLPATSSYSLSLVITSSEKPFLDSPTLQIPSRLGAPSVPMASRGTLPIVLSIGCAPVHMGSWRQGLWLSKPSP